jgi:ABC-type uncharacterized transport system auxiliary subunit
LLFWAETPPQRVSNLLQQSLENSGLFKSVATNSGGVIADHQINIDIREFYHDIQSRPGVTNIVLRIDFIELSTRRIIASKVFSKAEPATSYNVAGAVNGLSKGIAEIIDEIILWLAMEVKDTITHTPPDYHSSNSDSTDLDEPLEKSHM